jgi:uncharacterized protein YgbK (DUF1537 family)
MAKYGIIADDLTGASDTALELNKLGLKTIVLTYPIDKKLPLGEYDVIAVSTDSREDNKELAKIKVRDVCELFKELRLLHIYKKMDSTWRGNVGLEIEEILKNLNLSYAFVSSSFPEKNRITIGGYLLVEGKPVNISSISNDPLCSVKNAYLPKLLSEQTELPVTQIDLIDVEQGQNLFKSKIMERINLKPHIFLIDSVVDKNLENIIEIGFSISQEILFCGSAGLARAWINALERNKKVNKFPVIFVVGSTNPVNLKQVRKLKEKEYIQLFDINPQRITDMESESYIKCISDEIIPFMEKGLNTIIRTIDEYQSNKLVEYGQIKRLTPALGKIINNILSKIKVRGLVITGGSTAISILREMGANGIEVFGEVESGVPWGRVYGGEYHGLPVITKAGAFGSSEVFIKSLYHLSCIPEIQ